MTKDGKTKESVEQSFGCPYANRRELLFGLARAGGALVLGSGGVASLVDADGAVPQTVSEVVARAQPEEVERELHAQVERALESTR